MAEEFDLSPLWVSLAIVPIAALGVLVVGTLVAWRLSLWRTRRKALLETLLTLPLVLPPTAVGYYLLQLLGRGTAWGAWLNDWAGVQLLFTQWGAALAAGIMAFPLMVKTAAAAIEAIDREFIETAQTLGAGEWQIFLHVKLPLAYKGVLAGAALAFARALGEFGATLMVAGNIPGRTQTLPLALYAAVQDGNDRAALFYALILTFVCFIVLWCVDAYQRRVANVRAEK